MAKKKKPTDESMAPPDARTDERTKASRPPSREKVRYPPVPIDLYEWLEKYAASRSTPYDHKSIAWAARQAIYWFKQHVEGKDVPDPGEA